MIAKRTLGAEGDKLQQAVELRRALAENLKSRRLAAGLTQRQLAALINMSREYIVMIEKAEANISIDMLNAIAVQLNTTPIALLTVGSQKV